MNKLKTRKHIMVLLLAASLVASLCSINPIPAYADETIVEDTGESAKEATEAVAEKTVEEAAEEASEAVAEKAPEELVQSLTEGFKEEELAVLQVEPEDVGENDKEINKDNVVAFFNELGLKQFTTDSTITSVDGTISNAAQNKLNNATPSSSIYVRIVYGVNETAYKVIIWREGDSHLHLDDDLPESKLVEFLNATDSNFVFVAGEVTKKPSPTPEPQPTPQPAPSHSSGSRGSSGGSSNSGDNYNYYPRTADSESSQISFGTSKVIKNVELPGGVQGEVNLVAKQAAQTMTVDSNLNMEDATVKEIVNDCMSNQEIYNNTAILANKVTDAAYAKYYHQLDGATSVTFGLNMSLQNVTGYETGNPNNIQLTFEVSPKVVVANDKGETKELPVENEDLNGEGIWFSGPVPSGVTAKYAKIEHQSKTGQNGETWVQLSTTYSVKGENAVYHATTTAFSTFVVSFADEIPEGTPERTGTPDNPVANGTWTYERDGSWTYLTNAYFKNTYAYLFNPYSSDKEKRFGWFAFDEKGRLLTGWQQKDGKKYYFNPVSDGSKGILLTTE